MRRASTLLELLVVIAIRASQGGGAGMMVGFLDGHAKVMPITAWIDLAKQGHPWR